MAKSERQVSPEHRWPAIIAVLFSLGLYVLVPSPVAAPYRYAFVGVAIVLLIPLVILNPRRLNQETRWSRSLGIALAVLMTGFSLIQLVFVLDLLINGTASAPGVLLAAAQVWVSTIVAFALFYWEMDRGGPVARRVTPRAQLKPADFKFPQDEDGDAVVEVAARSSEVSDWTPGYIDYLYFALTNMMAFSPTDVMPLSPRAKLAMGLQAIGGFILLALVISRAVNILHG